MMNVNVIIMPILLISFLYAIGFAYALWKAKNKPASIALGLIGIAIIVLPFFSMFSLS